MAEFESMINVEVPDFVVTQIQNLVGRIFRKSGLYYRIFSRAKSQNSILEKMERKNYSPDGKKMQDMIGVRVVLYFQEDVDIAKTLIENNLQCVDRTIDPIETDVFRPERTNFVCRIPEEINFTVSEVAGHLPIDNTFEVQIRTVFSEGWHEIEHDFRYKDSEIWEGMDSFSRTLNGVFASLKTCEWAISSLFSEIIDKKLAEGDWQSAFKFSLRIHLTDATISEELSAIIDADKAFQNDFVHIDRGRFIQYLADTPLGIKPKKLENIIFFVNGLFVGNSKISEMTPKLLKDTISKSK